jgi:hypothetical protein
VEVLVGVEVAVAAGVEVGRGVEVLVGVEVAVAAGVYVEEGAGVCVGVAPGLQAARNAVSCKKTMKAKYLFRLVLIC